MAIPKINEQNIAEIVTDGYNTVEEKNYFEANGHKVELKQEKFELTITAEDIVSTDDRFTMDNLYLGDNYRPIDAYFVSAEGEMVRRKYNKGERRNTNQTLPRLAFQIFESQITGLSDWDKERFPIASISRILRQYAEYFLRMKRF